MSIRRTFLAFSILLMAPVAGGVDFSIPWYTIDSGGGMFSSGGDFELSGTIGQPDATGALELSGGQWKLTGGFWGASLGEVADHVFSDGRHAHGDGNRPGGQHLGVFGLSGRATCRADLCRRL